MDSNLLLFQRAKDRSLANCQCWKWGETHRNSILGVQIMMEHHQAYTVAVLQQMAVILLECNITSNTATATEMIWGEFQAAGNFEMRETRDEYYRNCFC